MIHLWVDYFLFQEFGITKIKAHMFGCFYSLLDASKLFKNIHTSHLICKSHLAISGVATLFVAFKFNEVFRLFDVKKR